MPYPCPTLYALRPMPYALRSMLYALCSMPYALCPQPLRVQIPQCFRKGEFFLIHTPDLAQLAAVGVCSNSSWKMENHLGKKQQIQEQTLRCSACSAGGYFYFALCPMPYALRPTPYALRPMPYALRPMPYAPPYALRPTLLAFLKTPFRDLLSSVKSLLSSQGL